MNRRSFFTRTLGALVAGIAARYVPVAPAGTYRVPYRYYPTPVIGGIDKATYTFWRNRQTTSDHSPATWRTLNDAMTRGYNEAHR